jgi:DNA polymerase I-like protein with 3'-5' exonuclease and polymerase domains
VVHYASLDQDSSVFGVKDSYLQDDADFHTIVAKMADIPRSQAKTINLGLFYGMGKAKLQAELGVSKDKANELFDIYHQRVPFVKSLMNSVSNRAQQRGQIRTLLGRLCRFHLWEPNQFGIHKALPFDQARQEYGAGIKRAYTYKALNKLIQGSAADMTKKSMLELYKEGIVAHIQVHDELDISVEDDIKAKRIKEIMESAVDLEIPNKVDYEKGLNWGEIK